VDDKDGWGAIKENLWKNVRTDAGGDLVVEHSPYRVQKRYFLARQRAACAKKKPRGNNGSDGTLKNKKLQREKVQMSFSGRVGRVSRKWKPR